MRDPSAIERAIVARLLSVDFEGVVALRAEADAMVGVELACTCGCPSFTPQADRDAARGSMPSVRLPVELVEMTGSDAPPRSVLCFVDDAGHIESIELVHYGDTPAAWPEPDDCSVLVRNEFGYVEAVGLPGGVVVRPEPGDAWVSFEPQGLGGFCANTFSCFREQYAADGTRLSRTFVK